MAKLSLCITAHNLVILNERIPVLSLLLTAHRVHYRLEHGVVKTHSGQEPLHVVHPEEVRVLINLRLQQHIRQILVDVLDSLPKVSLHFMGCHFEEVTG